MSSAPVNVEYGRKQVSASEGTQCVQSWNRLGRYALDACSHTLCCLHLYFLSRTYDGSAQRRLFNLFWACPDDCRSERDAAWAVMLSSLVKSFFSLGAAILWTHSCV